VPGMLFVWEIRIGFNAFDVDKNLRAHQPPLFKIEKHFLAWQKIK